MSQWTQPASAKLEEYFARIAALNAAVDADQGRTNEWPQQIEFELQLASTLDDEPILISHLVRNALIGIAITAAERSLNGTSLSDETAIQLQSAFSRVKSTNSLSRAFIGEQAM